MAITNAATERVDGIVQLKAVYATLPARLASLHVHSPCIVGLSWSFHKVRTLASLRVAGFSSLWSHRMLIIPFTLAGIKLWLSLLLYMNVNHSTAQAVCLFHVFSLSCLSYTWAQPYLSYLLSIISICLQQKRLSKCQVTPSSIMESEFMPFFFKKEILSSLRQLTFTDFSKGILLFQEEKKKKEQKQ